MLIGAVGAGTLADRLGRRRTILACIAWFTLFTGLCGVATGPEVFGALRFVAGLGLGGLVPSANALTSEFVSPRLRPWVSTIMMSGVPVGGSIAAVVALPTIPALGWEAMYLVAFGGVLLLALTVALLPESPAWLRTQGRAEEAAATEAAYGLTVGAAVPAERSRFSAVLRRPYGVATALFTGATVATMFAWYGLGTWLPKLMSDDARFDMGHPLTYLLALNLGAVAGSVVTAYVATRIGPLRSAVLAAGAATVGLAYLVTYPSSVSAVYAALVLAGIGTHGTLCLIIAAVASHYPARLRGTSLGVSLGVGRVGTVLAPTVGGFLLAAQCRAPGAGGPRLLLHRLGLRSHRPGAGGRARAVPHHPARLRRRGRPGARSRRLTPGRPRRDLVRAAPVGQARRGP